MKLEWAVYESESGPEIPNLHLITSMNYPVIMILRYLVTMYVAWGIQPNNWQIEPRCLQDISFSALYTGGRSRYILIHIVCPWLDQGVNLDESHPYISQ